MGSDAPTISPLERDALYSQAMDLLSGNDSSDRQVDPAFSDDLRQLLETLSDIRPIGRVELLMSSADLRRVISRIHGELPENPEAKGRSERTRLVASTCKSILADLDEEI